MKKRRERRREGKGGWSREAGERREKEERECLGERWRERGDGRVERGEG